MKSFNLATAIRAWLLVVGLVVVVPLAIPVLAQNNTSSQEGGASSSQTTRTTTTTTTSQPTTQTTTRTWVDPLWLILGGIALLAIILIVILASRGRSRDRVATHVERETVVKKE